MLADAGRAAERPQPPQRRAWAASPRSRPPRPGYSSVRPNTARAARRGRSSSTATAPPSSASATRCRSGRRARWGRSTTGRPARASSTSTASSAARPTSTRRRSTSDTVPVEPDRTPEEGYHFTEDMTDQAIDWIRQQKALMADKPFFIYFAPGATHAPHHVPRRVVGQVQGPVRRRLGRAARADVRPPEGARGHPGRRRADDAPGRDPRLGRHARRPEARPGAPDGGLRRASSSTPTTTSGGWSTRSTSSAILDDTLVYYIIGDNGASAEGTPDGCFNELVVAQRRRRHRDDRVHGLEDRQVRDPRGLQPLRRGLGPRDGHALPVDQAGRLALGRHPQRHDRPLARRHQGQGRDPLPVPPRHRRRADHPRGRRAAPSRRSCNGVQQKPIEGVSMAYIVRRRDGRRPAHDAVLRDVRATAASTTRAGRR